MVTQSHFNEIFSTLIKFREEGFMCDTVILARDKRLEAHGLLLAAASPVFKCAFEEDNRPGQHFVNLSHVDSAVMEIALHFIYTGKLLLPHVYTQTNELPKLFAELHHLGLEPQKLNGCEMRFFSPEDSEDHQTLLEEPSEENVGNDSQELCSISMEELAEHDSPVIPKVDFSACDAVENDSVDLDILAELVNGNAVVESLSPSMLTSMHDKKDVEEMKEVGLETEVDVRPAAKRRRERSTPTAKQRLSGLRQNPPTSTAKDRDKWQFQLASNRSSVRSKRQTINNDNAKMISLLTGLKYKRVKTEPASQDTTDLGDVDLSLLHSRGIKEEIATEIDLDDDRSTIDRQKPMVLYLVSSKNSSGSDETIPKSRLLKRHSCFVCSKTCKTRSKLDQHLLTHTGEKPHVCRYCGKGFTNKSNLERHVKMHTGVRPHLCDLCGKGFIQKTSLLDHMLIHYEAKAYKCTICGLSYNRKTNLRQHYKRMHQTKPGQLTGQETLTSYDAKRPFLCDLCGRGFATVVTLKFHKKLHTGEKPFTCSVCAKGFVQKAQLDQHNRIHTGEKPYVCQTCGKAFVYKDSLTQHTRIHTGEKPYVCQICSKAYTQSHHLKGHMLTHTGEKPYACQLCNKAYKNRADLRFHSARVHQINLPKKSKNNF